MTKKFYVTKTWHDWPEGGSYGTVVEANDHAEAEALCEAEMAQAYAEFFDDEEDPVGYARKAYGQEWHTVDCFDLDEFIEDKRQKPDDVWASDEDYPVEAWQYEVSEDNTRLGYWDWVQHQKDMTIEDA